MFGLTRFAILHESGRSPIGPFLAHTGCLHHRYSMQHACLIQSCPSDVTPLKHIQMVVSYCVYCIVDYSIILLVRGGNLSGAQSYQTLVQSTFGLTGYLILSGLQFMYPFIGDHN